MKKVKISTVLLSFIVFIIGAVVGGYIGFQLIGKSYYMTRELLAVSTHAEYTYYQYLNSDYDHAKNALLNHIDLLNEKQKIHSDYWDKPYNYLDLAYAYFRLYKLEKKNGHMVSANNYLSISLQQCKKSGSLKCSPSDLDATVLKSDERYK